MELCFILNWRWQDRMQTIWKVVEETAKSWYYIDKYESAILWMKNRIASNLGMEIAYV